VSQPGLNGRTIIGELIRNMELAQFEMAYSVLLPRVFTVYLHSEDHARLKGVFELIAQDAQRALCAHVTQLNSKPAFLGFKRNKRSAKEYKIAGDDWVIQFLPDPQGTVPPGDVEIHSELNDASHPGYQGAKTTLIGREPGVTSSRTDAPRQETRKLADRVYAELRYEDDSGPQLYLAMQNVVRVGRGGDHEPMELALYTNDEVSREHFLIRRDAATGQFSIEDKSTNGTWVDGKRLKAGVEQPLPERAVIGVADVLTLQFQVRK
jgi:FHA domain